MSESGDWRVMVSSTMRDLPRERVVAERVITGARLTPWYAERPPAELTGSPYELSREMARTCDLYLLIVGSRYGSHPDGMPADDPRSVTHLEFDIARAANPRKVRVFLPDDIERLSDPEHPDEYRAFVEQVADFRNGYDAFPYDRADLSTLEEQIQHAIAQWRDTAGRNAYLVTMRDTYSKERNPVTGAEMDADSTVLLKLRADVAGTTRRGADWDAQSEEEDGQREGQREGQRGERRGRRGRREEGDPADERIRMRAQPIIKLAGEFLTQFGRLVLLGEVGAGKSTLLRRLAFDLARDDLAAQDNAPRRIPVLVRATDLGRLALERPGERWPEVVGLLAERLSPDTSRKPLYRATVAEALYNGQALLLVDGLDEAQPAEQQAVVALLRQVGANQAILASRPAAYREELTGASWRVCQAQRLDPGQRLALIDEVFRGVREGAEGNAADGPAPDPAALESELGQRADLFAWAGNPLLLTLIATQYARDARLPESRARIYQFAIEDMRRQRATTARRYFTEEELDSLQRELALRMTEAGARLTTLEEARERYLGALMRDLAPETAPAMLDACAREVLDRSGVLQRVDADRWEFIHLSFREYLAASALAAMPSRDSWAALRNRTLGAQWEQVFFLLVSRLDTERRDAETDALIRNLIAHDNARFPALGGRDPSHATPRPRPPLAPVVESRHATGRRRRDDAGCGRLVR